MTEEKPTRLSQAQALIAALFAVVFSGELPENVRIGNDAPSHGGSPSPDRVARAAVDPAAAIPDHLPEGYLRQSLYRGCNGGDVAPTPTHGGMTDAHLDLSVDKRCTAFTTNAVVSEFKKANRIHGVCTRVAKQLGVTPQHVREVAFANRKSDRVMNALVAEMQHIDRAAEFAELVNQGTEATR